MEQFKQLVAKYFEKFLGAIILIATSAGTYFIEDKSIILNFFYLPGPLGGLLLGTPYGDSDCYSFHSGCYHIRIGFSSSLL